MTGEELKKYKQQIEALKKDFHKENPDNIESKGISDKEIIKNKIGSLSNSSSNVVNKTVEKISDQKNSFLDALKDTDKINQETKFSFNESHNDSKKNLVEDTGKKDLKYTNETKSEQKIKEVVKQQPEKVLEIKKEIIEEKKIIEKKIPPSPPVNEDHDEEKGFPFIKWLLFLVFLLLLGFLAYYFFAKASKAKKQETISAQEKLYKDSILEYDNSVALKNEIEEEYQENSTENIVISDTIFNITSRNPKGYYAIIGSYSELKNASILKTRQKTSFTSYIFEQTPIRIGLKLSDIESDVFDDLEKVRIKYPEAWILFNKN